MAMPPKWSKPVITELPDPPQAVKDAFAAQLALRGLALPAAREINRHSAFGDKADDPAE
jgi:hypothetical protein